MRKSVFKGLKLLVFAALTVVAIFACQDEKPEINFPEPEIPQKEFRYIESLAPDTIKFQYKKQDSIIIKLRTIPANLLNRNKLDIQVCDTTGAEYKYARVGSRTFSTRDSVWSVVTYLDKGMESGHVITLKVTDKTNKEDEVVLYSEPIVLYIIPKEPRALEALAPDTLVFKEEENDSVVISVRTLPFNLLSHKDINVSIMDSVQAEYENAQIRNIISRSDSIWDIVLHMTYGMKSGDVVSIRVSDQDTTMFTKPIVLHQIPKPEPVYYAMNLISDSVSAFMEGGLATLRVRTEPWNALFNDTAFALALTDTIYGETNKFSINAKEFVPTDSTWNIKINILDNSLTDGFVVAKLTCPDSIIYTPAVNIKKVSFSIKSAYLEGDRIMSLNNQNKTFTIRVLPTADLTSLKFKFDHDGHRITVDGNTLVNGQYNTLDASKPLTVSVWKYDAHIDYNIDISFYYALRIVSDPVAAFLTEDPYATIRLRTEPWNMSLSDIATPFELIDTMGNPISNLSISSKEFIPADSCWKVKIKITDTSISDAFITARLNCPDTVVQASGHVDVKKVIFNMLKVQYRTKDKKVETLNYNESTKTYSWCIPYMTNFGKQQLFFTHSGEKITVNDQVLVENSFNEIDVSDPVTVSLWKYDVHKDYTIKFTNTGLPVVRINTNGQDVARRDTWYPGATMVIELPDGTVDYEGTLSLKGRGNGTWDFPKKPYALKLDEKAKILGMHKHKRWILLANYKDRTLLRNDVCLWISKQTNLPYTVSGEFVELVWNGKHMGNYYLCEQIRIDNHRIDIHDPNLEEPEKGGYFMRIDAFLGYSDPKWSDKGTDLGFWSTQYKVPYIFKDPDEDENGVMLTTESPAYTYMYNYVKDMEAAIYKLKTDNNSSDWKKYLDPYTAVDFALIQEMTMNHDAYNTWPKNGPKSTYMYKDSAGPMCFGPMWDYDYHTFTLYGDFQYGNTTWNSTENQRLYQWEIMKMTNKGGTYYFSELKRNPEFKALLIERWNALKVVWKNDFENYVDEVADKIRLSESYNKELWGYPNRENGDWQLTFDEAIKALKQAFNKRWKWIDDNIGKL